MTAIYIADYLRSPFTPAQRGGLARIRPDDLIAHVIKALIERSGVDPNFIEDVNLGCAFPEGEQGLNIARCAVLAAGLPQSIGGATVNRWCGSSMQAIQMAAGAIAMQAGDAIIAGGVESMSRVPMAGFNPMPNPQWSDELQLAVLNMGLTAENLATRYGISREEQDSFALESQNKAIKARSQGRLHDEIISIGDVKADGCPRESDAEQLAGLKTAFKADGSITAGNASPLTDGASATLVCSEAFLKRHNLTPLAQIKSYAISGCAPEIMGIGPVAASRKALERAGISVADLDVIEMNEAFAAQVLACCQDLDIDPSRLNQDGGAIALGHPLGATGARLVGKAAALLKREGGRYGLATQCIGGGQGIAMVLEVA